MHRISTLNLITKIKTRFFSHSIQLSEKFCDFKNAQNEFYRYHQSLIAFSNWIKNPLEYCSRGNIHRSLSSMKTFASSYKRYKFKCIKTLKFQSDWETLAEITRNMQSKTYRQYIIMSIYKIHAKKCECNYRIKSVAVIAIIKHISKAID